MLPTLFISRTNFHQHFHFPHFFPSFFSFFFSFFFFCSFCVSLLQSLLLTLCPTSLVSNITTPLLPSHCRLCHPQPPLQLHTTVETLSHRRPTIVIYSLATTHCHHRRRQPPLLPTATAILVSFFFVVQVSLECKVVFGNSVFYFQKLVFGNIKRKQFSCIFETNNMFGQLKLKRQFFEENKILKYVITGI